MKVEIDIDIVDKIIVRTLKDDFISQQNDISRLLNKTEALRNFEQEDLWMHKEVSDAVEVLLRYYMYRGDADTWIAKHKLSCHE
jgi:hypothetical protein